MVLPVSKTFAQEEAPAQEELLEGRVVEVLEENENYQKAEIINYEILAEEIVRTLVGSTALILAVPLTTFLATMVE